MTDTAKLEVSSRERVGSAESRRLRRHGRVPANIYGHGEGAASVSIGYEAIMGLVHGGERVVSLGGEGTDGQMAVIREIQWDTFGTQILHVDLMRVDANEKVVLEVPVELRGTAPGVMAGGHLEIPLHTLTVECSAIQIPNSIEVRISHLEIDDVVHVEDLELPPGVTVLNEPGIPVVQVAQAVEVSDDELVPTTGEGAEPELVGGTADDGDEGDDS